MNLTERIEKDYLAAYKARDEVRLSVLRMLKTAAKNRQADFGEKPAIPRNRRV